MAKALRTARRESTSIILVHGLRGHPFETWTSNSNSCDERTVGLSRLRENIKSIFNPKAPRSNSRSTQDVGSPQRRQVFWPKDYLAEDISQAKVWTYGYNADTIGGLFQANNKNSVSGHGRDLKVRLERDIENKDPIIFLAHSLGGIIVKDALRRSQMCRRRTKLIIFLGTPHRGSALAGWGEIASNFARLALQDPHKKIVETLEVDNEVLDNIHEQFIEIVYHNGIQIHSLQEGRGISGVKGLHEKVVDNFSAKLDLPMVETVESIDANHMQMARCWDRSDENYRIIVGVLKQFLRSGSLDTDSSKSRPAMPVGPHTQIQQEEISKSKEDIMIPRVTTYYNMPLRNRQFTGRAKELEELIEKLITNEDCQKLALVGLGGVGKTQIALEFAYTVKKRWPEYSIFWVPALSAEGFEQAFRDIATKCSIALNPREEDSKESVRRYLNSGLIGKWLLVVDNSDDYEIIFGRSGELGGIADYLPESENGLTLFTSRNREVAVSLVGSEVVEIQKMDYEEAKIFLQKSLTRKELLHNQAVTTELLKELAYLPLAIAQAAAYLNSIQISIQDYLLLLRKTEQDTISLMSREFRDNTRYKNLKNSVAATWLVSFNQIRRSSPAAANLLSFMSCIENKAIPQSILPSVEPEERMVHAIGTLRAYSFVTKQSDSNSYDIHRLVHLATKVWIAQYGGEMDLKAKTAAHLVEIFPSNDYQNRIIWKEYLPHTLQFLRNTKWWDNDKRHDLCMAVGKCLQVDGRIREAVAWLLECFLWRERHFAEGNPDRLWSQHELAKAYQADGQIKKAVELLEQVVTIRGRVLAEDNSDRLWSQHELAKAYQADGQIEKAIQLHEQVVVIRETVLAEDNPDRLWSQHELAKVYQADGQIEKAIQLHEQVVAIREKVLAEDNPDRLWSQHELAKAYQANRQIEKAIKLHEQVVAIRGKVLAEDNPDRLWSQHELAKAYQADGQMKKAVELFEQVVAIRGRVSI